MPHAPAWTGRSAISGARTAGEAELAAAFAGSLSRASRVRSQPPRQRGWELYGHAPEAECIAKGKAHKPYELGCKVSITITNARSPGGPFVLHAQAFQGRPYDGHTLGTVIAETQALTGAEIERGHVGHDAPKPLRVRRSGQACGVHGQIKKAPRRRAATGHDLRLVLGWPRTPSAKILAAILDIPRPNPARNPAC